MILQNILSVASGASALGFRSRMCLYSICILLLMSARLDLLAQEDGGLDKSPASVSSTGAALATNAVLPALNYTPGTEQSRKIHNIITFGILEESVAYLPEDFTANITVKIKYGHASNSTQEVQQTLQVTYNKAQGVKYNARNYFSFNDAEYVEVTIITAPAGAILSNGVAVKDVLRLQNEMRVTCYYSPNMQAIVPQLQAPIASPDELKLQWNSLASQQNNSVQVEWTWLEQELQNNFFKSTGPGLDFDRLFKNNSTRIDLSVSATSYSVPLFYDGIGKLYYRVRASNKTINGSRIDGPWSAVDSFSFSGHSDSLNWQVSTSYAEEGKRKTVIQYLDGSLRSRQTVTKDNVTLTTVSAETFYDSEGRPAVQVLPAPGMNTIVNYTKNLNRFNGQAMNEDPTAYFDLVPKNQPGNATPPLSNTNSAAANYYSTSNPDPDAVNGLHRNIPNAEGYPYTVTRYTPDGTGRISAQSGAGTAFKMGSTRETKYFYGSAAQEELDGLFGTEVGNYTHYFKNMVKDANGQMSVSYVDMHGRTIATALAGDSTAGMQALPINSADYPNQAGSVLTRNLLDENTNVVRGNTIESINSILVPALSGYNFRYEVTPQALELVRCNNNVPLYYDCMYDLEITLTDESGDSPPIVRRFNNVNLSADDTSSTAVKAFTDEQFGGTISSVSYNAGTGRNVITFNIPLVAGSYSVRKTLKVSEASLEKYKQQYPAKGLCKTEQELRDSVYTVLRTASGCDVPVSVTPCASCEASLGTYTSYKSVIAQESTTYGTALPSEEALRRAYIADSVNCKTLCGNVSHRLELIRLQMLADMMPYTGQYALEIGTESTMYHKYDIFSTINTSTQPFYRLRGSPRDKYYYNNDYKVDSAVHSDAAAPYAKLDTMSTDVFSGLFIAPWAETLLPRHPEYAKLVFAENNLKPVFDWIENFNMVKTYQEAVNGNFLITSASFGPSPTDPFFVAAPGKKQAMDSIVTGTRYYNGLNLWKLAVGDVLCKTETNAGNRDLCYTNIGQPPYNNLTTAQRDLAWNRFKGLYSAVRDSMLMQYIDESSPLTDAGALIGQGYRLHFIKNSQLGQQPDWDWYPDVPGKGPNVSVETEAAAVYASRCSSYIDQWRRSLLQCPAVAALDSTTQANLLQAATSGMVAVCQKGTDAANAYGASTVAPNTPFDGSPRSFEEVINNVFTSYGIARDAYCNPFLIEVPKPNGKDALLTKSYVAAIDTCICSQYDKIKLQAQSAGYDIYNLGSLNNYLKLTYKDTLTPVLYAAFSHCNELIVRVCPGTGGGTFAALAAANPGNCYDSVTTYPINPGQPMPEFLTCGFTANSRCISCNVLSSLVTQFKSYFNAPYNTAPFFGGNTVDSAQLVYNNLFARFVNFRTGLQYSWMDYAKAALGVSCNLANYASNGSQLQTVLCSEQALNDTTGWFVPTGPCEAIYDMAVHFASEVYKTRQEQLLADVEAQYRQKSQEIKNTEVFNVTYTSKEYHYTLYYYDMAGNLVKTVPPKGVRPAFRVTYTDSIKAARAAETFLVPAHELATNYRYNSLNQVVAQKTPDAGVSFFWYDRLGRLAVSRNAKQTTEGTYSYTLYDVLGRIVEVGQKPHTTAMTQLVSQDATALNNWIFTSGSTRSQLTRTVYDVAYDPLLTPELTPLITQQHLRNRVSYTCVQQLATQTIHDAATYYTYDIHGNVDTLVQDYKAFSTSVNDLANRFKRITYKYDLISGKVNSVNYQPNMIDAFYHRYDYDASNRITAVFTSRDQIVWDRDAAYLYYKHGPLARTVLGGQSVQGIDYTYTLQGWLKSTNFLAAGSGSGSSFAAPEAFPVARDAFDFSLHYYSGDYKPLSGGSSPAVLPALQTAAAPLYNGNIAAMAVNIPRLGSVKVYNFHYDQLNRLVKQDAYNGLNSVTGVFTPGSLLDYKERISYDPNGNIITYLRNGVTSGGKQAGMDSLTYSYYPQTNQLKHIADNVNYTGNYTNDIDHQSTAANYGYDAIGNLTGDAAENITSITWTVYGKIASILKPSGTITYSYDAAGNRITKTAGGKTTLYVRDASGNVMSIYEKTGSTAVQQTETHLYGSSRLGIVRALTTATNSISLGSWGTGYSSTFTRGEKLFELSNHLGNVLVTVSDRKLAQSTSGTSIDYYLPDIASAQDYYPFGMQKEGRGDAECREELRDTIQTVISSDLNSGVSNNGIYYSQNNAQWSTFNSNFGAAYLQNQAMRVEATNSVNGLHVEVSSAYLQSNTTYVMEFDITEKSAGINGFFCQVLSTTEQPYRVSTQKTGTGHYTLLFTTTATGNNTRLRISARQFGANQYFVVDNFVLRKFIVANQAEVYSENFNNAIQNGINVENNGYTWKPRFPAQPAIGLQGSPGSQRLRVTGTNVNESFAETEFSLEGGKNYILRFNLSQDVSGKRVYLNIHSKTGSTWTITESSGMFYLGSGNYLHNFTLPAGATMVRLSFQRSTGTTADAPDQPYSIDNVTLHRLDTVERTVVTVCDGNGVSGGGSGYRYGFNGQEKSDEIKGEGNSYTAEYWEYDPRIGRRWNLDPKPTTGISEYAAFNNSPIWLSDVKGDTSVLPRFEDFLKKVPKNSTYKKPEDRQSLLGGTLVLTKGSTGTFSLQGKVAGIGVAYSGQVQEMDLIGVRDNERIVGGKKIGETESTKRTGVGGSIAGFGAAYSKEFQTNKPLLETTNAESTQYSKELQLPFYSVQQIFDSKTNKQKDTQTKIPLVDFKASFYLGVELSIYVNPGSHSTNTPYVPYAVPDNTSHQIVVPNTPRQPGK